MLQVDMKKGKVSIIILAIGIIFVIAIGTIMAKTPQQPYKEIRTIGYGIPLRMW
jgi:uncharacterized alpha/beta hydrolase family protein